LIQEEKAAAAAKCSLTAKCSATAQGPMEVKSRFQWSLEMAGERAGERAG
jgi:hypothetical protein